MSSSLSKCLLLGASVILFGCSSASDWVPSLTGEPLPPAPQQDVVKTEEVQSAPAEVRAAEPVIVAAPETDDPSSGTIVGRKVEELRSEYLGLDRLIAQNAGSLKSLQVRTQENSLSYYNSIATISSRLQNGTTPGNPRLVGQWNQAQERLEAIAQDVVDLNTLASQIAANASMSAYLVEGIRATYGLSGALEEDHASLSALEDDVNRAVVQIDRLLNDVSDAINRQSTYLASERRNLQTLSLAIANGELYGGSLANRAFSVLTPTVGMSPRSETPGDARAVQEVAPASATKPLVVIRFDRDNVDYQMAVYQAVSQALDRFPQARFEVMAVSPSRGNPAQVAMAASNAKRRAEEVLRTLSQMGLPIERVQLTAATTEKAEGGEVHIYLR